MIESLLVRNCQVVEFLKEKNGFRAIGKGFYWCGELVPVERDLASAPAVDELLRKANAQLIHITPGNCGEHPVTYAVASRRHKARKYLGRGYSCFALVREGEVLGDIWHARPGASREELAHYDFDVLGISPGPKDVYLFDMFLDPKHRGEALAMPLMGGALHGLGQEGWAKGYGFFKGDNIPALWVHRVLKYKELPRVRVRRILWFNKVLPPKPKTAP